MAIVRQHRPDAREYGVVIVPQLLHVGARPLAGDPAAVVVRRGDLAVQRDGRLQRHQRTPGAHEMQERLVQLPRLGGKLRGYLHFHAGRPQPAKALAGHQRIGIFERRHHARHPHADQRVHARRGAALVRAGLQIQIQRGAPRQFPGLRQRDRLGVMHPGIRVKTPAHNPAVALEHRPHHGVGAGQRAAFPRQAKRLVHECGGHGSNSDSMNFSGSNGSRSSSFSPTPT